MEYLKEETLPPLLNLFLPYVNPVKKVVYVLVKSPKEPILFKDVISDA